MEQAVRRWSSELREALRARTPITVGHVLGAPFVTEDEPLAPWAAAQTVPLPAGVSTLGLAQRPSGGWLPQAETWGWNGSAPSRSGSSTLPSGGPSRLSSKLQRAVLRRAPIALGHVLGPPFVTRSEPLAPWASTLPAPLPVGVSGLGLAQRPAGWLPSADERWWDGTGLGRAGASTLLGGSPGGRGRSTSSRLWSGGDSIGSDCGTCHALASRDMGALGEGLYREVEATTAGTERMPISSIGGDYEEGTWCKFRDRVSDADRAYIDLAWSLVVEHLDIIESYFDARDESWSCYYDALTGADKVRVDIKDMEGYRGKGWGDTGRGGYVVLNSELLNCEHSLISDDSYTIAERFCVVLDLSALIVHEVRHTCWINEPGAYSVEGWFRYHIQRRYGVASTTFCGQETWRCGSSTRRRDDCHSRDDLENDVINIREASGVCGVG